MNTLTVSKITDFPKHFSSAKKWRYKYFLSSVAVYSKLLATAETHPTAKLKYAIVTSKKAVHKRAYKRNRVRRRLRSAVLQGLKNTQFPPGADVEIVFLANTTVLTAPWHELQETVLSTLSKVAKQALSSSDETNAQNKRLSE